MKVAIIGGGVIGAGWAARFILNGCDVNVYDLAPDTSDAVLRVLVNARRSLPCLYNNELPREGNLHFINTLEDAVKNVNWVQESVPERLEIKKSVLLDIQNHAPPHAVIASSTSGFKPSQLQEGAMYPEKILVCHPFNPVYLLPLVEVVPSSATSDIVCDRAIKVLKSLGMEPLCLRKEIDGHIADRLIEAVWREALWLIHDDVATTKEVDDAIRFAMGIRYALMGVFEHYRLAGGEKGMRHALKQFGPSLKWPWTKLMDVPDLTNDFITKISDQSDSQSKGYTIADLERSRDDTLVGIIRAIKKTSRGAGITVSKHERLLKPRRRAAVGLIPTLKRQVPVNWIDYNGHMHESNYLEVFSQATDHFLELIGFDKEYINKYQHSYFTVETHLQHLIEIKETEKISVETQILYGKKKKIHLFHWLKKTDGGVAATGEHMLIHVCLKTRNSCIPKPQILSKLAYYLKIQANLKYPEAAGKSVHT